MLPATQRADLAAPFLRLRTRSILSFRYVRPSVTSILACMGEAHFFPIFGALPLFQISSLISAHIHVLNPL